MTDEVYNLPDHAALFGQCPRPGQRPVLLHPLGSAGPAGVRPLVLRHQQAKGKNGFLQYHRSVYDLFERLSMCLATAAYGYLGYLAIPWDKKKKNFALGTGIK